MKKIFLLLLLLNSIGITYSQQLGYEPNFEKSTWEEFKNGILHVSLKNKGESDYDIAIKDAVNKYWNFSKFDFIYKGENANTVYSESDFFLQYNNYKKSIISKFQHSTFDAFSSLDIFYLDKSRQIREVNSVEFNYTSPYLNIYMPLFVKHLNWHCHLVVDNNITKESQYKKIIKANRSKIKEKPLYILDQYLNDDIKNVADIKKYYTGEVYVISEKELEGILKLNEDVNLYFCKIVGQGAYSQGPASVGKYVGVGRSLNYIYNVKTGALLYYDLNIIDRYNGAGIIPYHIKNWNE